MTIAPHHSADLNTIERVEEPAPATDVHVPGGLGTPSGGWRRRVLISANKRLRIAGVIAGLALLPIAWSYVQALTYPGDATIIVRTVDWARDHGGGPLVDSLENWYYTRRPFTRAARPPHFAGSVPVGVLAPTALAPLGSPAGQGEGVWQPGPPAIDGTPGAWVTFLRPDPAAPGVVAGIARFDQHRTVARLIAGTREPDRRIWPEHGQVPPELRSTLVATFNSGFLMDGARGGYFASGRQIRPLHDGAASLVIDDAGRIDVGAWGRDVQLGPHVSAVRQNLALIVDGGKPVAGLDRNAEGRWGSLKNQLQYTWRSAVGVDAAGTVYYVAGDQLTLAGLARALAATGASRGMQLDMHPNMVHLFLYRHPAGEPEPAPTKLLPAMRGPATRYLFPDQRDFLALTQR